MGLKQFPQDYAAGLAVKLLGAKADGTMVYIVVPAGGDTLDSVSVRGSKISRALTVGDDSTVGMGFLVLTPVQNGVVELQSYNAGVGPSGMCINKSGGNLGIGNANPSEKLHVSGNILASGSITPGSDKRLKKTIKNLPSALSSILELRPVSYTLREDNATALGFIADEVREIFPDLILEGKDEQKMLAMNYMGLSAPIVKSIQEQQAIIQALTDRIEALEAK